MVKKSYLQVWYIGDISYRDKYEMFKCMKTVEQTYKGGTTSKNNQHQSDVKHTSQGKKKDEDMHHQKTPVRATLTIKI